MERIADLLVKLQEAGYVHYTHFKLQCGCSEYKKAEFNEAILKMEDALINWQKTVQSQRKKYPHLNYYTSQQLLDLQQELGKLKKSPDSPASIKLKQLLLSVTPRPDQSKITRALKYAMRQITIDNEVTSPNKRPKEKKTIGTLDTTSQLDPSNFSEQQKEIYDTLTEIDEYKVCIVLSAFSELGEDADKDTLRNWCMENEYKFKDEEDIVLPETTVTQEDEEIAEDDPLVQELIEEEYDAKIALEAVRKARGDPQIAREVASALDLGRPVKTTNVTDGNEW